MQRITTTKITAKLDELSPKQLSEVYDFVSFLAQKKRKNRKIKLNPELVENMLLAETAFRLDWDTPEEDEAWADL